MEMRIGMRWIVVATLTAVAALSACAGLQNLIQPPVFDLASERSSQVRLVGPSLNRPLGGAEVRVWTRVQNPNAFGFTLSRLAGNVLLANQPAANIDLPLGLPLDAAGDTIIPIDVTISFADVPDLADHLTNALGTGRIDYALRGTVSVDAGSFGQPTFGPSTWLNGEVNLVR